MAQIAAIKSAGRNRAFCGSIDNKITFTPDSPMASNMRMLVYPKGIPLRNRIAKVAGNTKGVKAEINKINMMKRFTMMECINAAKDAMVLPPSIEEKRFSSI